MFSKLVIMIRLSIQMYLCFCLVIIVICGTDVDRERGFDMYNCSCYSFVNISMTFGPSKHLCKSEGNLVSMETIEEWEFIKTEIQNRTEEEWWIGLEKRDGNWTWLSNHTLTYDKWLGGKPANNAGNTFVKIVKEFNGRQGMFNITTDHKEHKGRICEYTTTNCSGDKLRWCRSTPRPVPTTLLRNTTRGLNESNMVQPRYPSECAVIMKTDTPVIIPIMVALAGLVVIVAFNIIIISWRRSTIQESSKKKDESGSHSEQENMDPTEGTTTDFSFHGSGIEGEENVEPREDCIGESARNSEDGNNDITDIDERCGNTSKARQPYYVNVQESTQFTDAHDHYASVSEVNETDGQRDSFVVVRTYSIVRNDDDGQTDDANTSNYATVSDTLGTDRQTVTLVTTESGYASVDVINNKSHKEPSIIGHDNEHDTPTSGAHVDGSVKYSVSEKDISRQLDNQNPRDDGYAAGEVIYDNCLDIPPVQEDSNTANNVRNAGLKVEYAAVNKSMKKRNRSVRETAQISTPTETSYATGDVEYCQESATAPQVEYAAVNKSMKKRNRSVRETAQISTPTETSYATGDVEYCQESATAPQVEYAAVNKSKKRNRSDKESAMPIKPTAASYASVDVECCQESAPVPAQRSRRKKDNPQHTQDHRIPNAGVKVEYTGIDKSKKKNTSVNEVAKPSETNKASYASVDVIYDNC